MKKIDKLIVTGFIGPAVLSYFVATFVLVMQFLWKYIDEILGKGLTILELMELIFYYAVTLIPMAVPITVLISSVMVFGDMAEKYELSSMKSAGISLLRIMLPSILVAGSIGLFSLFASNFLKPASLLQFNKRFQSIRKQKTALAIEEGIFNNAFNETIIRVDKIDKNKRDIHNVLIYDHTPNDKSLIGVMSSKGGEMYTLEDGRYFVMQLDTGVQYKEMEKKSKLGSNKSEIPFMRTYFDQWTKTFDMSQFDSDEGLLNFNRNREDMMNSWQLLKSIDTFNTTIKENNNKIKAQITALLSHSNNETNAVPQQSDGRDSVNDPALREIKRDSQTTWPADDQKNRDTTAPRNINTLTLSRDSLLRVKDKLVQSYRSKKNNSASAADATNPTYLTPTVSNLLPKRRIKQKDTIDFTQIKHFAESVDSADYRDVIVRAQTDLSRDRDELMGLKNVNDDYSRMYEKYLLRLNQQYSWAAICLVFLFIGAPLGSIIRKGGYGYPLLVAILFYMIFIITTIFGEKLVRNESMGGLQAAWLPCMLLAPFAAVLTFIALRDIRISLLSAVSFLYTLRKKKGPKEVISNQAVSGQE